jgi:hypothetical protein
MKFLRRKVQGTETVREEGRVVHREIEITVEREWISVPISEPERSVQDRKSILSEVRGEGDEIE